MKKILIIILVVFVSFLSSCKGKNNHQHNFVEGKCECGETDPNYVAHVHNYVEGKCSCGATDPNYQNPATDYEFVPKEELENLFNVYYTNVEILDSDGAKMSFIMCENNSYFYYKYKNSNILIEKANGNIYSIDEELKIRTLERQLEFDMTANKKVVIDLFASHLDRIDNKYTKTENQTVGQFNCDLYAKTLYVDAKNYLKYNYYIDKTTGGCVKGNLESCLSGSQILSSWEFKQFIMDEQTIDNFMNAFNDYNEEIAPLEFSKWPNTGLSLLLPEYQNGSFSFGLDYDNRVKLIIENTRLANVQEYANSLKDYGFKDGKSITNEAAQFIYVTYNDDNILVKIVFTRTASQLEINISQSTKEEINAELNKL